MIESAKPDKTPDMLTTSAEPRVVDARANADRAAEAAGARARAEAAVRGEKIAETGGPKGLEPTRYGDWEKAGRCTDF